MRFTERKNINRIARSAVVCLLAFSVLVTSAMVSAPAEAASSKSPFLNKTYTHDSRFNGNLIVNGVDVSTWQSGKSDWDKAKAAGVDYVIMRATFSYYGSKNLKMDNDNKFKDMYTRAKASNMMIGVYVFSQAKNATEAIKEADFAVKRLQALGIGPKDLALPVYMDYEFAGGRLGRLYGLKRTNATNAAVAFCNRIKSYGYTPGIYASTSFYSSLIDTSRFSSDVDIWCAQYYSRCQSGTRYSKWQYSSSAKINGILHWTGVYKSNTDVNFWYINKNVNSKPLTVIKGKTTLSVADAKNPDFTITNGKTTLKKGTDYIVGGIRNNKNGSGYAYIKGIGKYGGYALVPITVAAKTSGSASTNLNSKCANYLTYANTGMSSYIGNVSTTAAKSITLKKGKTYTLTDDMNIRKGAGTKYGRVKRSSLSKSLKKKTYSGKYAVLKSGKKVKALQVKGNWIRIARKKWVCAKSGSEVYVK